MSLEEIHAWAASAKAANEKAQSLMADPGATWPDDVADDVQTLSDVYFPPTIDYFDAMLQEKTVTGAWNVPRPTYAEGGVSAQSNLSQKLGVDIGSSESCEGR
ncbi:hypothetical protein NY547_14850 [Cnuibacter physcomitrellae]|uniref:hypothetical protein n=1 Tax=Cnuibacter physcomitrellae TaxID=1619308 RepID=UPI002175BA00|nr:hypothetical protein [Cnuibacter physcomitrellae]MCS5498530.1 hypothetical protein [Cnuibacter physcomitrellae]